MDYKNQAISEDLFLAKIKPILTNVVVVVIAKEEIKNSGKKDVIYTILIISKHRILPELRKLRGICLIILSLA